MKDNELNAMNKIITLLTPFESYEQERILIWVLERLRHINKEKVKEASNGG